VFLLRDLSVSKKLALALVGASVLTLGIEWLAGLLTSGGAGFEALVAFGLLLGGLGLLVRFATGALEGTLTRLASAARDALTRPTSNLRARRGDGPGLTAVAGVLDDLVTRLREREGELERLRGDFDAAVATRTLELAQRNERLQNAMEEARTAALVKARLLANMSHELRTPMNGILGMNELLLDSALNDQQKSYTDTIKSSAESLLEIIDGILDFSKIEAVKLRLEAIEFDLARTLEEVLRLLSGPAHKKGLELVSSSAPEVPQAVRGDPTRLRQVLTNLIGNAIKFTEQGRVAVRVDCVEERDDAVRLRFAVQDSGIGIARDRQMQLFLPFSQVDASTTRRYGGTGLGLAICKQLVELMGGEIGVESELGVGSTFWFTTVLRHAPGGLLRSFEPPAGVERPRVLVAEASTAAREMLHQQLAAWGFEHELVSDASRAAAALRRAAGETRPFGLCLLDRDLVGNDELSEALQERGAARPRLILLTWPTAEPAPARPGFEALAVLAKPVRPSALFDALMEALGTDELVEFTLEDLTPAEASPASERSPLRILLAEDNAINQTVAAKILARGGFRCDVVGDGRAALEAVRGGRYDVVLMDCQMPELDGFEATAEIRRWERENGRERSVHVIALTANAMQGDRERCLEMGMDDYLPKPVKPDLLLEKLRQLARAPRAADAAPERPAPALPFDATRLLERFAGRPAELKSAVQDLDKRSMQALGRLKLGLGIQSSEGVRVTARELQDVLALFSSERLQHLAQALEAQAVERRFDQASSTLDALQAELARCRASLPEVMARAGEA